MLVIIFLIYAILFTKLYKFESKYSGDETTFIGTVYDYKLDDDKITLYIKAKEKLIVNYRYDEMVFNKLSYGDEVLVEGKLNVSSENTIPNTFNYRKYLYNKKIYYTINASSIKKIKNNDNVFYTIKNLIYSRLDRFKSFNYIKVFLLGDNNLDGEVKESYRINGISHLFSISGTHISFIIGILYYYLDKVTYHKFIKYIIVDIFLIFYLFLAFSSSLFRSTIMYILSSINYMFDLKIKKIDIIFITLIIAIIINPFIIYDIGFIYSYLISLFLVCFSSKCKSKIKGIINITYISFLVSFPITLYNSYEINFISIILNIILVPIISIIIFPLSILTFIFPMLDNILLFLCDVIEDLSLFISNICITKFIFCKPGLFLIIIYYIVIIVILKRKRYFYLFIILIMFHYIIPYIDSNFDVMMFDVGQGDSIFIKLPNDNGNILIDTGNNSYTMKNGIISYLKSIGVNRLQFLVISHGDYDHMGEAINLVENFKIEKVIFNCGEFNDLEQELIKALDKNKIPYHSCIKELNIDNNKLYFLNNKNYGNENDNSSIIYTELNKHKFLFMGDAGVEVEEDLIKKYNLQDIDVLKVGHHGSKTSTGKNFIDEINPKYSIISVGKNNRYGHPNKEVLNTLSDSKVYRTDQNGSVMFKIKNYKLKIETCTP